MIDYHIFTHFSLVYEFIGICAQIDIGFPFKDCSNPEKDYSNALSIEKY